MTRLLSRSGVATLIGVRDLQWSRRRFAVAVVATGLVFALGLLMTGVRASFDNEIQRTVASFDADAWLVPAQSFGPFESAIALRAMILALTSLVAGLQLAMSAFMASMIDIPLNERRVSDVSREDWMTRRAEDRR